MIAAIPRPEVFEALIAAHKEQGVLLRAQLKLSRRAWEEKEMPLLNAIETKGSDPTITPDGPPPDGIPHGWEALLLSPDMTPAEVAALAPTLVEQNALVDAVERGVLPWNPEAASESEDPMPEPEAIVERDGEEASYRDHGKVRDAKSRRKATEAPAVKGS